VSTLGSIPVLGWLVAYSADLIGSMIGSTIAYFIARKYGMSFIRKIFDDEVIEKFQKIKIRPEREIESIFIFRVFGGNIVELFCYGAGFLRVNYFNYILASFLAHVVIGIPTFYLIRNILSGKGIFVSILFAVILAILFFTLKHRYFEIEK
ncbi:MAG: VTT domain-containing protein, partial [Patescibacteria group bacterium]